LEATVASGLRRSGPPEWTWGDRGEQSPLERATAVDLSRPWRVVSAGAGHRSGLGATVASGRRRSGPPEWTWSDRGERSPPERATGVDLNRPWRAVSAGAGDRSGLDRPWRAASAAAGHRSGLGATVASGLRRSRPPEWT